MNRVSPEIAKEIFMLFEDRHWYSLAREQVAEHHACGTATHNATRRLKCACHSRCLPILVFNLDDDPEAMTTLRELKVSIPSVAARDFAYSLCTRWRCPQNWIIRTRKHRDVCR